MLIFLSFQTPDARNPDSAKQCLASTADEIDTGLYFHGLSSKDYQELLSCVQNLFNISTVLESVAMANRALLSLASNFPDESANDKEIQQITRLEIDMALRALIGTHTFLPLHPSSVKDDGQVTTRTMKKRTKSTCTHGTTAARDGAGSHVNIWKV